MSETTNWASDVEKALALAVGAFTEAKATRSDYILMKAERVLFGSDSCSGRHCWRLTFKLGSLVPQGPDAEIGKGGEIFVEVDLKATKATLTGYGE